MLPPMAGRRDMKAEDDFDMSELSDSLEKLRCKKAR